MDEDTIFSFHCKLLAKITVFERRQEEEGSTSHCFYSASSTQTLFNLGTLPNLQPTCHIPSELSFVCIFSSVFYVERLMYSCTSSLGNMSVFQQETSRNYTFYQRNPSGVHLEEHTRPQQSISEKADLPKSCTHPTQICTSVLRVGFPNAFVARNFLLYRVMNLLGQTKV